MRTSTGNGVSDRILVAYGSKHGATAEIADAIGATLRDADFDVDVERAGAVRSVDPYRAVVLGSAVYMGRWRGDAARLLRRRRRKLSERDVWLFSSGPVGDETDADDERWTKPPKVQRRAREIGAHDHAVFGGCVSDDAGGFVRKTMARDTAPELRDRRDWDAIKEWAGGIAATLATSRVARSR